MKKIAFFTDSLGIGGIERAIINYLKMIDKTKYNITLFLEKKEGEYLNEVPKDIKVIYYNICENKNVFLRKVINAFKLLKLSILYYHSFDFAACFKSTIKSGAILSKRFSKNNAFWFHGNYWNNQEEANYFLERYQIKKYRKIVFVSNSLKEKYQKVYPDSKQKFYVINNPIDINDLIEKSKEKIDKVKPKKLLLNVGRHSEEEKHLTMLFDCVSKLIKENYHFELWLLGSGPDTEMYKKMVRDLKIDNYVKFLGFSKNVYPYIKISDGVVLSSYHEGNPVVFLEAKALNKPVITTDVSDAKIELDGYGIVTKNNEKDFLNGLRSFLDDGYEIKKKFNIDDYNYDILNKLDKVIED